MIRLLVLGSRADGERAAKKFGIVHIGFDDPGPQEGRPGETVIGTCDDVALDKVEEWFNSDPPDGVMPGSVLWYKNATPKLIL